MPPKLTPRGLAGQVNFQPPTAPINESCGACNKDHVWVRREYEYDADRYELTTNALAGADYTDPVIFPGSTLTGDYTRFQVDPRLYVAPDPGDPEPNFPSIRGGATTAAAPGVWDAPGPYSVAIGVDGDASGKLSTVIGGSLNVASGERATAVGGTGNTASGASSVAMGAGSTAANAGSFVWADSATTSATDNEVRIVASGGFQALVTDTATHTTGEVLLDGPMAGTGELTVTGIVDPDWVTMPALSSTPIPATHPDFTTLGTYWVYDDVPSIPLFSANTADTVQLGDTTATTSSVGAFEFDSGGSGLVQLTAAAVAGETLNVGAPAVGAAGRMLHFVTTGTSAGTFMAAGNTIAYTLDEDQNVVFGQDHIVGDGGSLVAGQGNSIGTNGTENYKTIAGGQNHLMTADFANSTIGGGQNHTVSTLDAAVGGGLGHTVAADTSVIVGGNTNSVTGGTSTTAIVVGGDTNTVSAEAAGIGGGRSNVASGVQCVAVGGYDNSASGTSTCIGGGGSTGDGNVTSGTRSCVVGGLDNQATGQYAFVPGGRGCRGTGRDTIMLGRDAADQGNRSAFVWSGRSGGLDASLVTATDTFYSIFELGYTFWTDADRTVGAQIAAGGSGWSVLCDRDKKENLRPFENVLERLEALPLYEYNYLAHEPDRVTRGPVAQDWHALFGAEGKDPLRIGTLDADAVSLAALRELAARAEQLEAELASSAGTVAALETAVAGLAC